MIRGSATLEEALSRGHTPKIRAEVWQNNRRVSRIEVGEGTVDLSGDQFQQRSGQVDVRATPESREMLAMPGANLRIWKGVEGVSDMIPVLWGPARAPSRSWGASTIQVPVEDLARRVIRDSFPTPRSSLEGATVAQQIQMLWRESIPWVRWTDLSGDMTRVPSITWESDRAAAISDLAASIGCETWIRPSGEVILRRTPTVLTGADHKIAAKLNLSAHEDEWDWDSVVNHCVVRSDADQSPVFGEYADWTSPTGIDACGRCTIVISSGMVTTSAQCEVAAETYVLRSQGAKIRGTYTAVTHPGVEIGDIHQVMHTEARRRYVLDSVSFTLRTAGMSVGGRVPSIADNLGEQESEGTGA